MTLTTIPILDGTGAAFDHSAVDDGSGNILLGRVAFTADGLTPVNPSSEEKQDAIIAAIAGLSAARWQSGPVVLTNADQALKAAGAAGVKNWTTWGVLICDATWTANTVDIRDGTTVLFSLPLPAGAGYYPMPAGLALVGSAATALNIKAASAVTGTCTANFGGHFGSA
ncbi:hypothetical protein SAMN02745157_1476 [Kaistia soli DSM 19436]|uniref:Uncharacterized protein n=1 Tax=Kaistia soli DSM 19436 TaxID=1122133 RepID=A0A1M4YBN5_9HYPH|nr:hypothetical protein [Kaistia soli]SHF03079.1 hypothetical protein SAMN02745157_1476 [Kaistia soli DSM 19436]